AGFRVMRSALTRTSLSSTATVVPTRIAVANSPLGPFTFTRSPANATDTPPGIVTGFLPTRDMAAPLPDLAHELAAESGFACFAVGHDALGCRNDGRAEAAHHLENAVLRHVHPPPRGADPPQAADHRSLVGGVLEVNAQHALALVVDELEVVDVALAQQHL